MVEISALILGIRACHNRLAVLAARLHGDLGINPSMRAVMEILSAQDRQTVPAIARARGVSRQHIQTVMNALCKKTLVTAISNPKDRRSPLFCLTEAGKAAFEVVRSREKVPLARLARGFSPRNLRITQETLGELERRLDAELAGKVINDH